MRRFHAAWEPTVSGMLLRECVSDECTMDHVVTMATDEQARLAKLLALDVWPIMVPHGWEEPRFPEGWVVDAVEHPPAS